MSNFTEILRLQTERHPAIRSADVVKLCYQAAFGAEHLISDTERARAFFFDEFNAVNIVEQELFEWISPQFVRVNLSEWKRRQIHAEWLFAIFVNGAQTNAAGVGLFNKMILEAGRLAKNNELAFSYDDWQVFMSDYEKDGVRAVHHSNEYREAEMPHYRIISAKYLRTFPLLERIAVLDNAKTTVIAIDGRAASGKTTLALQLSEILGAGIIHADDFFLPAKLRTKKRLAEPGGNVHYERLLDEIIPRLRCFEAFSYQIFNCSEMRLNGERQVDASRFRIVEGSYSAHPKLGKYADFYVFSDIAPKAQAERIKLRDGERADDFVNRWIPMEENYFKAFDIAKNADIILTDCL